MSINMNQSLPNTAARLGFWFALLMAVITAVSFALAVTTLPMSGPNCQSGCLTYPYNSAAFLVPHDYIWMIPAILMAPLFVGLMACLHAVVPEDKKIFSLMALVFAAIYAGLMSANYFIQIEVMQPSLLKGETEGLALFSQYNPHGIFIALEDLGYLMMSLAFFISAFVFVKGRKLERSLFYLLAIGALAGFGTFIGYSLYYGQNLEYRFEVLIITINWITLLVAGILLSIFFRRVNR